MRLKHYAASEHMAFEWDVSYDHLDRYDKPTGFWVSVVGEDDWYNWCKDSEYRVETLENEYDVVLSPDANILIIDTSEGVQSLADEYRLTQRHDASPLQAELYTYPDWARIKSKYDGIIIAPYQWSCRLDVFWYYSWDCASGCIWNTAVIESVTLMSRERQEA